MCSSKAVFSQGGASTQSCDDWGNGDPCVQVKPCFHKVAHPQSCDDWGNGDPCVQVKPCFHKVAHPHSHVMTGAMVIHVFK